MSTLNVYFVGADVGAYVSVLESGGDVGYPLFNAWRD